MSLTEFCNDLISLVQMATW